MPLLSVVPVTLMRSVTLAHADATFAWKIPLTGVDPRLTAPLSSEPEICGRGTLPEALTCQFPLMGFWGVSQTTPSSAQPASESIKTSVGTAMRGRQNGIWGLRLKRLLMQLARVLQAPPPGTIPRIGYPIWPPGSSGRGFRAQF